MTDRRRHRSGAGAALGAVLEVALAALFLGLFAIHAGRPQPFADSKAYYALGQATAAAIAGHARDDAATGALLRGATPPPDSVHRGQDPAVAVRLAYTVAASRSPYWSLLFYLAATLGTAWLVVAAQALVAALVVWIAVRALGAGPAYLPMVALLTVASSLPVETMFLMPDLFAGLVILAAAVLAFRRDRLARWEVAALWATMAAGALFHTSHLLVLAGLGLASLASGGWRRRPSGGWRPASAGLMLSAAAVGLAGAVGYPVAVRAIRHEPVYAPPFLSARLLADGPGRALLARDCARGDLWGWCRYRDRPLTDVNVMLWGTAPAVASFQAADYPQRLRMIAEQRRFVIATAAAYPAWVARTVATNVGGLFLEYGTRESLDDRTRLFRDPDFAVLTRIVPGAAACARAGACGLDLDIAALDRRIGVVLVTSWLVAAALAVGRRERARWLPLLLFLLAGLALNATVCGALSGDSQRYQSRTTWLLPLAAAAMVFGRVRRRRIFAGTGRKPSAEPAAYPHALQQVFPGRPGDATSPVPK